MKKAFLIAAGSLSLAFAAPAVAQEFPLKGGDVWSVAEVTIDDGHFGDYADHLAGTYRKTQEFAKSKGWIKSSIILHNVNKRANEPDLYLVLISDHVATPAEEEAREKEFNAYLATTSRDLDKQSGARATYRKLGGTQMLQELVYRK